MTLVEATKCADEGCNAPGQWTHNGTDWLCADCFDEVYYRDPCDADEKEKVSDE